MINDGIIKTINISKYKSQFLYRLILLKVRTEDAFKKI
mgnify:CR=1 FL=1